MRKFIKVGILMFASFLLFGCGKYGENDVIKDLEKQLDDAKGYHLTGELTIKNNEDNYKYDVDISHKKDNFYRVGLKSTTNNHEQVILKNKDGVYVLTPSLNKSFKFESEWPFNSSQTYILQTLIKDIKDDKNREFKATKEQYIFTVKVDYTSNVELISQKVYFDKKLNIQKVEVYNKKKEIQMEMEFKETDLDATYKEDYFSLKRNMAVSKEEEEKISTVSKIEDVVYPMYIPTNTQLESQDKVKKGNSGERMIMNFTGDKPFMIIQETVSRESDILTIPVSGEPELLATSIAAVGDGSISWMLNGIEYYAASDVLTEQELLEVVKSVNAIPLSK